MRWWAARAPTHDCIATDAVRQKPIARLRPLSQTSNGLMLISAKVVTMGLGFVFWVMAARLFPPHEVGIAAGVVAAMMLCIQLALLGFGAAFISHFPSRQHRPEPLLDTSLTSVAALAVVFGVVFLLVAGAAFGQLDVAAASAGFALVFVVACVFGAVGVLLDQVATALRRGDQALIRAASFAAGTAALLPLLLALGAPRQAQTIIMPWAIVGLAAYLVGVRQLRRAVPGYRPWPGGDRGLARELVATGLPNYALTLAERAPGLVLPVVVAELLSPAANATWYAVWMTAWVVYIVPIQVGMTVFAEMAHDPAAFRRSVRRGVRLSLAVGVGAALLLALGADLVLSILGPHYAADGVTPLRVLLLAVLPLTFVQAYFATCRARRTLREAMVSGWVGALASVGAATAAGVTYGLLGMAIAWVLVQYATGLWSLWRLRLLELAERRSHEAVPGRRTPTPDGGRVPAATSWPA